jgi:hypothetical protein
MSSSTTAVQLLQLAHERYERCKVRYTSAWEFGTTYAQGTAQNPIFLQLIAKLIAKLAPETDN